MGLYYQLTFLTNQVRALICQLVIKIQPIYKHQIQCLYDRISNSASVSETTLKLLLAEAH